MSKRSAGLLVYRNAKSPGPKNTGGLEVFLVHPGGPFWAKKDLGAWSIPKGEYERGENPLGHAKREFEEETGLPIGEVIEDARPDPFIFLGEVKQPSGKIVSVWAVEGNFDATKIMSNTFPLEWPPKSGKQIEVPEIDRGEWFALETARRKILAGQAPFLERLEARLKG